MPGTPVTPGTSLASDYLENAYFLQCCDGKPADCRPMRAATASRRRRNGLIYRLWCWKRRWPLTQWPSYSLLDCSSSRRAVDLAPTPWRQALRQPLEAVK